MARKANKVTVIVPAYNEAECLPGVLEVLKNALTLKRPIIHDVVVVDDGSTDGTDKIAERFGVAVRRLPTNRGKGAAFLEGLKYAKENGSDAIITCDADALNLRSAHLRGILKMLKKPRNKMVIGGYRELNPEGTAVSLHTMHNNSGFRAIKMDALDFLFRGKRNENAPFASRPARRFADLADGFGLEKALQNHFNWTCREHYDGKVLIHETPYRKGKTRQEQEVAAAENKINARKNVLKQLLAEKRDAKRKGPEEYKLFLAERAPKLRRL